jgi:hypothetical protein
MRFDKTNKYSQTAKIFDPVMIGKKFQIGLS